MRVNLKTGRRVRAEEHDVTDLAITPAGAVAWIDKKIGGNRLEKAPPTLTVMVAHSTQGLSHPTVLASSATIEVASRTEADQAE